MGWTPQQGTALFVKNPKIAVSERFGSLVVAGRPFYLYDSFEFARKTSWVVCKCDCGQAALVRVGDIRQRKTVSCGCRKAHKGGYWSSHPRLYSIHHGMVRRCHDRKAEGFLRYGARGIAVCDSWRTSPIAFIDWALSNGYAQGLEIDRKDNSGGYFPDNCRWVTRKKNANNKTNNRVLVFNGETKTVSEWADQLGTNRGLLSNRLNKLHWSVEKTLTTPPRRDKRRTVQTT